MRVWHGLIRIEVTLNIHKSKLSMSNSCRCQLFCRGKLFGFAMLCFVPRGKQLCSDEESYGKIVMGAGESHSWKALTDAISIQFATFFYINILFFAHCTN